jgi:F-type H+-transporting ATPase subunit delta
VRDSTVVRNYAEVLFELGERNGQREPFAAATEELVQVLQSEPRLRVFLESPKIKTADKKRVLRSAANDRWSPLFLNFVLTVVDKGRERFLRDIGRDYLSLIEEHLGHLHARVTLAREPDERTEREIASQLSSMLGQRVVPRVRVDPAILGGVVVRYGDRLMDGSLRRRLVSLRRRMLERELPTSDLVSSTPGRNGSGEE